MSGPGITVLKNNAPWGPFTREQVREGLIRGDFTLRNLAHAPGLKEWLPLGEVLESFVERTAYLPYKESVMPAQPPVLPKLPPRPPEPPVAPAPLPMPVIEREPVRLMAASFISRFIAFLIDCAILFVPLVIFFALGAIILEVHGAWEQIDHESRMQEWALLERNFHQLFLLTAIGLAWFYTAMLESSRWQGTVGKQCLGIKVTDIYGERISFLRATGRYAAKYLSALTCFIGFIMPLFSSRGLALHDRLTGTHVVRK